MKQFTLIFICLLCLLCETNAQDSIQFTPKSGFIFRKMYMDYQSQNGGSISTFKDYRHGFELGYIRPINQKVWISVPFRIGIIDRNDESPTVTKKVTYSLDAQIQYRFFKEEWKIIPYLVTGVGGVLEDEGEFNIQIPAGLGFQFKVARNAFVNLQSEFRYSLGENRNNLQHGIGFTYLIGPKEEKVMLPIMEEVEVKLDSDKDGIIDELDLCPSEFGTKELNGCPDDDKDGIANYEDKCPNDKGTKANGGCPDTDGDGIIDNEDECPKIAGPASNKGCPEDKKPMIADMDGDGVPDAEDKCPKIAGNASAMGCPDADGDGVPDAEDKCPNKPGLRIYNGCPDTDGDGIDDSRDKCPNTPGSVANDGCPEIKKEDKKTLDVAMQAVQFQTGSAVLKAESAAILRQIASILDRYPDFVMTIEGHTDNTGSATANQTLSEKRAKACYTFLAKEGIDESRINYIGFGESRPISTNENEKGRSLNRRVEFKLIPRQ